MHKKLLSRFPTEKLIFHKPSGQTYVVEGLVGTNSAIMSEDVTIPIEPDDYFERFIPNGIKEYFKVTDTGYIKGTSGIPDHYQTKVVKMKADQLMFESQSEDRIGYKEHNAKRNQIFISHRTTDVPVAEMIKDFLVNTGIQNEKVFCSFLPGNDVNVKISSGLKERFNNCAVIILILSKDYYNSPYCLNEAGIAWYLDAEVVSIPIGLPEIDHSKKVGLFNNEYKLRRLDSEGDVSYMYDVVHERLKSKNMKHSIITQEIKKLADRYAMYIAEKKIV